jgi:hypothetical protein
MNSDPIAERAANAARSYAAACDEVISTANAVVQSANSAVGARKLTQIGHEISRQSFRAAAEEHEAAFVPLYKTFLGACRSARAAAADLRSVASPIDVELVLLTAVDAPAYSQTGIAVHLLRANFGTTPAAFLESLATANAAIQGDIFSWGEEGFIGQVYLAPASTAPPTEPTTWSAEPAPPVRVRTWLELRKELELRLPASDVSDSVLNVDLAARGRSQAVSIRWHASESGPGWIRVESAFARVSDAALLAAARLLGSRKLFVGMARVEDTLVIQWTGFVGDLSPDTVVTMVGSVAGAADRLEAHLSGGGDSF